MGRRGGLSIPVISGTPYPYETLTSTVADQWFADDVAIVGETGSTYVVRLQDAGKDIRCGTSNELFVDYDLDAALWLLDVQTAGGNVTQPRINAADVFYQAEKAAGIYGNWIRFYFPIWGVTAANAICIKSRTSGTFFGGVTHGAGFVQGDGSSGYFSLGDSMSSLGLDGSDVSVFTLEHVGPNADSMSSFGAANSVRSGRVGSGTRSHEFQGTTNRVLISPASQHGIYFMGKDTPNTSYAFRRTSPGIAETANGSGSTSGSNGTDLEMMRRGGFGDHYSNARIGAAGIGTGMSYANASAASERLKTFWEACTGLTLT